MTSIDDVIRLLEAARDTSSSPVKKAPKSASIRSKTQKRKPSEYSKKYSKAFKQIAPKHKKKSGGWKQGGYKRAVKQAHAKAKRMR